MIHHILLLKNLVSLVRNIYGLEIYTSFSLGNKLVFIGSFQFLSFSLDSLVKNIRKNDFKYTSQEFDNELLELVKQKGFYPYKYMNKFYC